jgi:glutaconate CoA-transferase, subunit B
MSAERDRRELLIATIADLLDGVRHVAVGASSPIPAAGAMLARARNERDGRPPVRVSILGSERHNFFTNGSVELFDCAAQGRVDAFFLGGGQIDGYGNINLVGTGAYPATEVRWPGSFGSAYLYHLIPRVILFREEHSRRVFVPKVDFISAAAITPEVSRRGGPYALLTNMALFDFDSERGGFRLRSVHPPYDRSDIRSHTGFDYDEPDKLPATARPDTATLSLIRGRILDELSEAYPAFARGMMEAA